MSNTNSAEKSLKVLRSAARRITKKSSKSGRAVQNPLNVLSDSQLVEIYLRFEKGQDPERVRRVMQIDWRVLKGVRPETSLAYLKRFREDTLSIKQKALAEATPEQKVEITENVKRIVEELDGLGSLRWLITEQIDRVSMCRDREKIMKLPLTLTNTVVRDLGDLLEKYLKLEIDLGLIDSKEAKVDLLMREKFMHILTDTIQDSGKNLLGATSKFLAEAEKEAITFEEDAEGSYVKAEENKDASNS